MLNTVWVAAVMLCNASGPGDLACHFQTTAPYATQAECQMGVTKFQRETSPAYVTKVSECKDYELK